MKKVLLISALVMTIVASMVSGTLAVYNGSLDSDITGNVYAAKFKLIGEGKDGFNVEGLSIAPSDTDVVMKFSVSNFEGLTVSEVKMDIVIKVKLGQLLPDPAVAIPLTAVLTADLAGITPVELIGGTGTLQIEDVLVDMDGETKYYTVTMAWPEENPTDPIDPSVYAGQQTTVLVTVEGTQQ